MRIDAVSRSTGRRRPLECRSGEREASARGRVGEPRELRGGSLRDHMPAASAGARTQIDDMVGAADGVFIVLDHHQGVALLA